ncbi:ChbG/HpnK family deacetylase [Chryseobacterium sp. GMJ5]|uniref:ChbG/HpnK family deacetylase n=1 Tax=Chryseobacterium gilvum TaxID=2976534 RepID=A0ABT2VW79_9FLAO|nr:ChbG/HpnK family deacetylase [Chryseobacterium gilvum]MCU7614263.1 ChbG/HpnK family deacetylase [Chryseobacterium gilvum]
MKNKIIINADDLGLSPGVNEAIYRAHNQGFLTHASLMANADFFEDAVDTIVSKCKNLNVGLHINLTCCKSLSKDNHIADKHGILSNTFIKLLFLHKNKKVLQSIENEIEAQLDRLKSNNIHISHIDGHEHIHIIPSINKIVKKIAQKHGIKRIREINEGVLKSFRFNFRTASFANIIKLFLLRFLSLFNSDTKKNTFYSILNTCEINEDNLFNYLENTQNETVEIMLHPSISKLDENYKNLDIRFLQFLQSDYRRQEYELCFSKKFENYEKAV